MKSREGRDDKAAFQRTKGNREDVWVDMRLRVLNFGDETPGNFTRRIRARVLQLSFAKKSSAFSLRLRAVSFGFLKVSKH